MYQFVRDLRRQNGGKCNRNELLKALESDSRVGQRLAQSRGFRALPSNMRHSGEITIEGDEVVATPRALRRASVHWCQTLGVMRSGAVRPQRRPPERPEAGINRPSAGL